MTKAAEKTPETTTAPLVQINRIWRNRAGTRWCEWDVAFPEGGTVDDLSDPSIWRKVQDHRQTALTRGDHIWITAFDRTWKAFVIVSHATLTAVVLSEPWVMNLPPPQERLAEDDRYRVEFDGAGYVVIRKVDGQRMSDSLANPALAERAMTQLYSKVVR